jgi:hypothetical protein
MKKFNWPKIIHITGFVALLIGILDPLEGSVVIVAGIILVTLSSFLTHDRFLKFFLLSFVLIATGVFFLFYLSSLGGFGGTSGLSWWYGTLILPYPIGWIIAIIYSIKGLINKNYNKS